MLSWLKAEDRVRAPMVCLPGCVKEFQHRILVLGAGSVFDASLHKAEKSIVGLSQGVLSSLPAV